MSGKKMSWKENLNINILGHGPYASAYRCSCELKKNNNQKSEDFKPLYCLKSEIRIFVHVEN